MKVKRKLSSLCIFLVAIFSFTLLPAYAEQEHLPYVIESGYGSLRITSSPAGADVYADDIFASKTAPCTILLPVGKHDIRLVIPGYETCSETVMIEEGKEHVLKSILLPELPEAMTIIVNTEEDHPERSNDGIREQITVESLTGEITLRDALIAVQNDSSDTAYRIDFAENVDRIEFIKNEMYLVCSNLTINGDRNRDGVADVTFYASEGGLLFRPTANLRICGLIFQGESPLAIRPVDYGTEDILFESIYVLGCEFQNPGLIAFGGACKTYNSRGSVGYSNINFCGNKVDSGDVFFSYSGNTDNSIADGIYYCANKLSSDSCMTVITADCNTWYIYGRDTFEGNGGTSGQFETSDDNIVRNVSISGNNG
ncbi:PEGA domain-containing protein, partial [Candidatus Nomurabacteria bacterium]|nr:PEGA domain-containing protein [Candidatus Nomurabacteria bacterium]